MPNLPRPDNDTDKSTELEDGRMSFASHIRDLRTRLRNAVLGLIAGFLICYQYRHDIYNILAKPLHTAWDKLSPHNPALGAKSFYFDDLIEPFWTYFSLSLWASVFLTSPITFYQLWKFIAPGLYKNERRWGIAFSLASALLFTCGAVFCYYAVLPVVIEFLLSYAGDSLGVGTDAISLRPILKIGEYLTFSKKLLIGFGLIFELPLVILVMSFGGLVTHRSLWKFNRWAILLAFVVSAILTPPDMFSQLLMAGPLIALYNFSIILSFFVTVARERKENTL